VLISDSELTTPYRLNQVIPAISLSTTYKQSAVGVHKGFEYSRSLNPTRLAFESLIAALEVPGSSADDHHRASVHDLPSAFAFSSGSATTAAVVQAVVGQGGHLVSVGDVYGSVPRNRPLSPLFFDDLPDMDFSRCHRGTFRYFTRVAAETSGISTTFVDLSASTIGIDSGESEQDELRRISDSLTSAFRDNTKVCAN
jgi:cystathionine gamma-lyase